jgi:asparagine N-glycosylation enzyme membrane subunit Stt3
VLDSHRKSTGTQYTTTVALLILAFIFVPAVLILSRPLGFISLWLALAASASCVAFAWVSWKRHSQLTIPSLDTPYARSK